MRSMKTHFFRSIGAVFLLCILPLLLLGEDASEMSAKQARELIQLLAEDGTEASYTELKSFFQDVDRVKLLLGISDFDELSGPKDIQARVKWLREGGNSDEPRRGYRSIDKTLDIIGDHQNERSYNLLLTFLNSDYEYNVFRKSSYSWLLSNLLKYRDSKSEEVTDVLKSELSRMLEGKEAFESKHPFLLDDNVFFQKERQSRYVTENGDVVFEGRVKPATSEGTILKGLYLIESDASYAAIQSFLTSWPGRETSDSFEYPEMWLKLRRYDLPVIDIYEALMRDTHYLEASRANFVKHFFDNSVVHYAHHEIEDPERDFAQIKNASEASLLRMLEVADYALTLDFLPMVTVDLVYAKRAEIIDRLVEMGYSREELNKSKVSAPKTIKKVSAPESATEDKTDEVIAAEPIEEPAEKSSNWWLWLIGALVVIGGLGLVLRHKN